MSRGPGKTTSKTTSKTTPLVSASELARLGYCERQLAFDARFGRKDTAAQRQAQLKGVRAHAAFHTDSERIVAESVRQGPCILVARFLMALVRRFLRLLCAVAGVTLKRKQE